MFQYYLLADTHNRCSLEALTTQFLHKNLTMRITALSTWLAACTFASSTIAFSALSKKHQRISGSTLGRSIQPVGGHIERVRSTFSLNVASAEVTAIADMERGMGGRLEQAFETAKMKGEAAFVGFITAGYPKKEGAFIWQIRRVSVRESKTSNTILTFFVHDVFVCILNGLTWLRDYSVFH